MRFRTTEREREILSVMKRTSTIQALTDREREKQVLTFINALAQIKAERQRDKHTQILNFIISTVTNAQMQQSLHW